NVVSAPLVTTFEADGAFMEVGWYGGGSYTFADRDDVEVVEVAVPEGAPAEVVLASGGLRRRFVVHVAGENVDVESSLGHAALRRVPRFRDPADQVAAGSLLAPMPGGVIRVDVQLGQQVREGESLVVMEA